MTLINKYDSTVLLMCYLAKKYSCIKNYCFIHNFFFYLKKNYKEKTMIKIDKNTPLK
jgi:hypothetical protein